MEDTDFAAPSEIVRLISSLVARDEPAGNRTLYLVALAGVCQRWREAAVEVASTTPVAFDGADNAGIIGPKATLLKFRKAEASLKRATFLGASKLLKGYSDITLTGDSISDEILVNIARVNGWNLTSIKLVGASRVTDTGITCLLGSTPNLKQFILEDAGPEVKGTFVPAILQLCKQLEVLHIEGAEGVNWAQLHLSGAWWTVAQPGATSSPPALPPQGSQEARAQHSSICKEAAFGDISNTSPSGQLGPDEDVNPSCNSADGTIHHGQYHQRHHQRVSSEISEALSQDDSDDESCMSAASDSTSISVPATATAALAVQLQQTSLQDGVGSSGAGTSSGWQPRLQPSPQQQQQQRQPDTAVALQQGQQDMLTHPALRRLHVRFANVNSLLQLIERCPGLTELHLDGPAYNIQAAAAMCPNIKRLAFLVSSPLELDAALFYLNSMTSLRGLELEIKGMMLSTEQLRVIGMLPLRELALDSHAYRQQPSMPRPQYSHLDSEGVKGLVDSICQRMRTEMMPLKLSLCGATALKQEAVSALLRLPMLTAIDTGGCIKLTPMDRMRLVAKVKAGQGMLDSRNGTSGTTGALAALRVPHGHML